VQELNSVKITNHSLLCGIKNIKDFNLDWVEFGVYTGGTANFLSHNIKNNKLYLFDSFIGLPEDWKFENGKIWNRRRKNSFNLKGKIPKFENNNVIIKAGWFENTIPAFVKEHKEPLGFIHIDCDIYSSTKTIFDNINELIIENTIIVFDEYYNYANEHEGWKEHEYKAFQEFIEKYNRKYEYIARTNREQIVVKILK